MMMMMGLTGAREMNGGQMPLAYIFDYYEIEAEGGIDLREMNKALHDVFLNSQ